jgi:tRNA U34 5-carboxymethylaminomethyl modifying enzyme MnmG/GidA
MKAKLLFPLLALGFVLAMAIYFMLNPSYQKSLEAKFYYETGNYKEAYRLANEAFHMDVYNRMAATIMAQSQTSMKYESYINQAKEYLQQINAIVSQESLSDADRAKIKMMSQIMVESYKKLAPSVVTDSALVDEARNYYQYFEKLLEKVTR